MRKFVTVAMAKAAVLGLVLCLGGGGTVDASDLDGVRLIGRSHHATSHGPNLRSDQRVRFSDRRFHRSRVEARSASRDGVYDLRSRDRYGRYADRRDDGRFFDRRDWPPEYREGGWRWSNRDVRRRVPVGGYDGFSNDGIYDGYQGWYGDGSDYPSVIPGRGAYAGGVRAWVEPGNGSYFSIQRYGEDGSITYSNRRRGAQIIDARRDNRSCSFEAGVCVIRGR